MKCTLNTWAKCNNLCANCPFGYSIPIDDGSKEPQYTCDDLHIFNDVYRYLEDTSQHMLTPREVQERGLAGAPLWFENLTESLIADGWKLASIQPPYMNEVYMCDFDQRGVFYNLNMYNKTWRCWAQPLVKEKTNDQGRSD